VRKIRCGRTVVSELSDDIAGARDLYWGNFHLSTLDRSLTSAGKRVSIGGRSFDLLLALLIRAGQVVTQEELVAAVWPNVTVENYNLRAQVSGLRRVLADASGGVRHIVNVPGRGYTFTSKVRSSGNPAKSAETVNLPPRLSNIVGRDEAIKSLSERLLRQRFLTVVGTGGIGKTTVAVAVAHSLARRQDFTSEACYFVDLSSLTNPSLLANSVAAAIGCVSLGTEPEAAIHKFLLQRRTLIILDNCEHVIDAAAYFCERLFLQVPSVYLVATSREALRAEGENVYSLAPLESPVDDNTTAKSVLEWPAVQLFMERAKAGGYNDDISDNDAQIIAQICRRLDGIALAIELVASRIGTYGVVGTADLLAKGAEWRLPGKRSAPPRQETLLGMLEWSFSLLSNLEQLIFCRLSVFVGRFSLEAAQTVAADIHLDKALVENAINGLVSKSLLATSPDGSSRYNLLYTSRYYAAKKLRETGNPREISEKHAIYYLSLLRNSDVAGDPFEGLTISYYDSQMGDLVHALEWSFSDAGDTSVGLELSSLAAPIFLKRSDISECQYWCRTALRHLRYHDIGSRLELKLQESLALSSNHIWGNRIEVRAALERCLELCQILGDKDHELYLLAVFNVFLTREGDFKSALGVAQRSFLLAKESGGNAEEVLAEWMLSAACHLAGDQVASLRHAKQGFKLAPNVDMKKMNTFAFDLRARIAMSRATWLLGLADQARATVMETIAAAEKYNHPVSYSMTLVHCIPVLLWLGDYSTARNYVETVVALTQKHSLPIQAVALALKGELLVQTGDAQRGTEILAEAQSALDKEHFQMTSSSALRALSEGFLALGDTTAALKTIDAALARAVEQDDKLWLPDIFRSRGEILLAQPQPDFRGAEMALLQSLELSRQQSVLSFELRAALPLATIWSNAARGDEAKAMLGGVFDRFTEGFGTKDLLAAGNFLSGTLT
jgi:predicted ATPase/DNA-binding winged helix-turn-helix (wHTH) protein